MCNVSLYVIHEYLSNIKKTILFVYSLLVNYKYYILKYNINVLDRTAQVRIHIRYRRIGVCKI